MNYLSTKCNLELECCLVTDWTRVPYARRRHNNVHMWVVTIVTPCDLKQQQRIKMWVKRGFKLSKLDYNWHCLKNSCIFYQLTLHHQCSWFHVLLCDSWKWNKEKLKWFDVIFYCIVWSIKIKYKHTVELNLFKVLP